MNSLLQEAQKAQNAASHPTRTSWVAANAGSGKTRVLTDRVARLLLKDVPPQKILCLTYTKAAAAEMQARLFKRLGAWAMLDDDDLRAALTDIGEAGAHFTPEALNKARTLFARALETPGGLKIQTIHAFCGHLLRRFPLEAGVSPGFTEIDETQADALQTAVLTAMAEADPSPLDPLARHLTNEAGLGGLLYDILKHRDDFARFDRDELARVLDIAPDLTDADVLTSFLTQAPLSVAKRAAAAIMQSGTATEQKKWADMNALPNDVDARDYLNTLKACVLKKDLGRPARPVTAAVGKANPWILDAVVELQDAILGTLDALKAITFLARATDLAHFATDFLTRYQAAKTARGALDFDDLIDRTRDLLIAYETTQWVLYRLDGGIAHILVDEAQDTSPRQWEVIDALSAGFTETDPGARTLFVVGDHKQSIFGFQGARPEQLADKREELSDRLEATGDRLQETPLHFSFRSAAPILELVDRVFADDPIGALDGAPTHRFFDTKPGRVDLWPFKERQDATEEGEWWEPIDAERPDDPVIALADDLAAYIGDCVQAQTPIPDGNGGWRAVTAGDFLILVRSRNRFFHRLIAQLKANKTPVAGADRLRIKSELAVKDLLSLLRFLDNERDDLSLAEALRSPLFGLSEAQLFDLAHGRKGLLWDALRTSAHTDTVAALTGLRDRVDYDRPFEILETMLTPMGGRARLIGRLGDECTEAVDELLSQTLTYEQSAQPTLSGFLAWIDARDIEVKRDMDAAGGEVRVMTIHGAKGLEAPVVVLADVSQRQAHQNAPQVLASDGLPYWAKSAGDTPEGLTHVEDERRQAENRETARLLYVALTRAESWLIVCGAGAKPDAEGRWFGQVAAACEHAPLKNEASGPRIEHVWSPTDVAMPEHTSAPAVDTAGLQDRPTPFTRIKPINPSQNGQAHALPGEGLDPADAMARGSLIHDLIEALAPLPEAERATAGARFLRGAAWDDDALATALRITADPNLAHVFAPSALTEVSISARPKALDGRAVFGRIDRLIITDTTITAVDFKSNHVVPPSADAVPAGILTQMGLYALALAEIYPDRTIETAILWTETGHYMALPHANVSNLTAMFHSLDPSTPAT